MAIVFNQRSVKDVELQKSIALPNASTTPVVTGGIDLGSPDPYIQHDRSEILFETTAATGVDTYTITLSLEDSADNVTFAAVDTAATKAIVAASSAYAATTFRISMPQTERYIRGVATMDNTSGGNASDGNLTISVVY